MRKIRRLAVLALGAATALFLDPSAGGKRRARVAAYVRKKRDRGAPEAKAEVKVAANDAVAHDVTVIVVTESDQPLPESPMGADPR